METEENVVTRRREDCVYTSCYCEENVWKLCDSVRAERLASLQHLSVVFISNENRTVPLWKQKSGHEDRPVVWDYHVVLMQAGRRSEARVYDLDSVLPFPCSLKLYVGEALRSDRSLRTKYHRKLRVLPAGLFLSTFASDRSHMRNSDGSWKMPPPSYPPITTTEGGTNLDDFISMEPDVGRGAVFSLGAFMDTFLGESSSSSSSWSSSSSTAMSSW